MLMVVVHTFSGGVVVKMEVVAVVVDQVRRYVVRDAYPYPTTSGPRFWSHVDDHQEMLQVSVIASTYCLL